MQEGSTSLSIDTDDMLTGSFQVDVCAELIKILGRGSLSMTVLGSLLI